MVTYLYLFITEVRNLHEFLEVGPEEFRFEPLYLSVLDGLVIQERVQFHGLVGCCAVLVLQQHIYMYSATGMELALL